jgi:NAD(P)-dependent dehydrogenase (short-subunit alcohol dehydrogenase family)
MKTILITGGSRGIGKCVVNQAILSNYKVIFTYNKNKKLATELCKKYKDKCVAVKVDLGLEGDRKKLFQFIEKNKITIDCLVNNAAYDVKKKKFNNIKMAEIKKIYEVNVFAVYDLIKQSLKYMKNKKEWKSIINLSSTAAKFGGQFFTHYAPTKSAIENLTIGLSKELCKDKIRVVCVAPGVIDTKIENRKNKDVIKSIPNSRLGKPDEVAKLIIWLASESAEYINGTTITISGGR